MTTEAANCVGGGNTGSSPVKTYSKHLLFCSHAEIGSQASLSRWCPMGVRVQVSLVALIYFHSSVGSEHVLYTHGVIGSNPIGSTTPSVV